MGQKNKTLRLQSWIVDNFDDWNTICGKGKYPISEQECLRLMKILVDNDFKEITLVLITCHYYAIQERAGRNLRAIVVACEEELKRRGINPDAILQ